MAQVFDGTLGAAFLGHYMTAILFGITSMQTWVYFKEKNTDPIWLRSMVLVLWFLDGVHTTLLTSAVYYDLSHFGDLLAIFKVYWSIPVMIIVTGVSNTIVRGIFAYRLWKLSNGGILVPAVIGVLSLYHTGKEIVEPSSTSLSSGFWFRRFTL
ncbi:hypothetical protein OBBRIDRAFT_833844 [Obba rivulosa]|uniref:Uncharacterized protein n=1 Tax=Obba rivulosa TaxID=1052685 RepID=A0A8E2AVS7_9APHY|nr:hypothetical protein OBBRIDRAFT_833844 [Obba rivulosa]